MILHLLRCQRIAVAYYSFTLGRLEATASSTFATSGLTLSANKVIGSRFRVQACPGLRLVAYASESATGCGYEFVFRFYGFGFPSPHLDMPGLGLGFKGYKMLISETLCFMVWIGLFHALGYTWNSTRLTRNTIDC